jgi:hypothetical protein
MTAEPTPIRSEPNADDELRVTIPGLPPGAHEVELVNVAPGAWTDETTGEVRARYVWTWATELEDGRIAHMDQRTGRNASPRSRLVEVLVALVGPAAIEPTAVIDLRELVGRRAILSIELAEGRSRVAGVTAIPKVRRS